MNKGKVFIVGVGPGDYKLMTLKAMECIENADAIVYDRLINPRILALAKEDAELIDVGKEPNYHKVSQEEINQILVELAIQGKNVARVKGGDPFIFGRGGEEAMALQANEIAYEIVPGISSAIAAAAYGGIPLTHRDYASSFHVITGHEKPMKGTSSLNYLAFAQLEGTLVFLMGIQNAGDISKNLIAAGKDPKTSIAVIENGTTVDQRVYTATLETMVEMIQIENIQSPAVIVIGEVVKLQQSLQWFGKKPLSGKRIVITRSKEQAGEMIRKIVDLGGEPVLFPTIKIVETPEFSELDHALASIESFDWLVFTSINGVKAFFNRMKYQGIDIRKIHPCKLAAIGEKTAEELRSMGLIPDYVPKEYLTTALLAGLLKRVQSGEKVLIPSSNLANSELEEGLSRKGVLCQSCVAYLTLGYHPNTEELFRLIKMKKIDVITFTSSSTVTNFISLLNDEQKSSLEDVKIICIGPITVKTAIENGLKVFAQAEPFTEDGLIGKIIDAIGR